MGEGLALSLGKDICFSKVFFTVSIDKSLPIKSKRTLSPVKRRKGRGMRLNLTYTQIGSFI
jgi:hypothetical protein